MGSEYLFVDKKRGILTGDAIVFRPDPVVFVRFGGQDFPLPSDCINTHTGAVTVSKEMMTMIGNNEYTISVRTVNPGSLRATRKDREIEKELKKKPSQNYLKLRKSKY